MKTPHTPAPWKQASDAFYYITDQHGNALAHVIDSYMPEKETRANARLIAAAPDLLAEMQDILEQCCRTDAGAWHDVASLKNYVASVCADVMKKHGLPLES